jgi:hypothetical protein
MEHKQYYSDDETRNYAKWISDFYDKEIKDKFTRKLIEDILKTETTGLVTKHYCELLYANYVINKFLAEFSSKLPKLEVKPSKIHGNGLFSKKEIARDHILTFYPIHLIYDSKTTRTYASNEVLNANLRLDTYDINRYMLSGKEDFLMVIGGHPDLHDEYLNGHIANHSKKANAYYQLVKDQGKFTNIWILISTKFIDIGDEILVDYGPMAAQIIDKSIIV